LAWRFLETCFAGEYRACRKASPSHFRDAIRDFVGGLDVELPVPVILAGPAAGPVVLALAEPSRDGAIFGA
jgi:hypothetical protein